MSSSYPQLDAFSDEPVEAPQPPQRRRHPQVSQASMRLYPARGDALSQGAAAPKPAPESAPFQKHSPTSKAAARTISPKLSGLRLVMLKELRRLRLMRPIGVDRDSFGMTDNELIAHFVGIGWNANTPRARRVDLTRGGYLEQMGTRGKSALWALTERALRWEEGQDGGP
jgi:hypothetical protein